MYSAMSLSSGQRLSKDGNERRTQNGERGKRKRKASLAQRAQSTPRNTRKARHQSIGEQFAYLCSEAALFASQNRQSATFRTRKSKLGTPKRDYEDLMNIVACEEEG